MDILNGISGCFIITSAKESVFSLVYFLCLFMSRITEKKPLAQIFMKLNGRV